MIKIKTRHRNAVILENARYGADWFSPAAVAGDPHRGGEVVLLVFVKR